MKTDIAVKPQHTPTPLKGTNGKECIACKKVHSDGSRKFCPSCCDSLTLKEKVNAERNWRMESNEPSSRPWHLHDMELGIICSDAGLGIVDCNADGIDKYIRLANAAYIVRAVNAHEEMLGALKLMLVRISEQREPNLYNTVKDIIAKAEGKS